MPTNGRLALCSDDRNGKEQSVIKRFYLKEKGVNYGLYNSQRARKISNF